MDSVVDVLGKVAGGRSNGYRVELRDDDPEDRPIVSDNGAAAVPLLNGRSELEQPGTPRGATCGADVPGGHGEPVAAREREAGDHGALPYRDLGAGAEVGVAAAQWTFELEQGEVIAVILPRDDRAAHLPVAGDGDLRAPS